MTQPAVSDIAVQEPFQTEEPTEQTTGVPSETQTPAVDVEALSTELAKFNIDTPAAIEGMVTASKQAGNSARLLGDERNRNTALEQQLAKVQAQVDKLSSSQDLSHYDANDGEVDLKDVIKTSVREVIQTDIRGPQQEYIAERNAIMADPDYSPVAEVFEAHINSPQVQNLLAARQTTQIAEYNKVKTAQYKALLGQASEVINQMKENPVVTPPHVETNGQSATFDPSVDDEDSASLKKMVDPERYTGSNDDLTELVAKRLSFANR